VVGEISALPKWRISQKRNFSDSSILKSVELLPLTSEMPEGQVQNANAERGYAIIKVSPGPSCKCRVSAHAVSNFGFECVGSERVVFSCVSPRQSHQRKQDVAKFFFLGDRVIGCEEFI
jgi:hypothetical protein